MAEKTCKVVERTVKFDVHTDAVHFAAFLHTTQIGERFVDLKLGNLGDLKRMSVSDFYTFKAALDKLGDAIMEEETSRHG